MNGEYTHLRVVHLRADQIGGQQIGCELDAGKIGMNSLGGRFNQKRLCQTRHTFQQNVSISEQRSQNAFDQFFLSDDNLINLCEQVIHE